MTRKDVDHFDKTQSQLLGLYSEIATLSKKSQNDALNKFKLKFVNQILIEANLVLGKKYRPFPDFSVFVEDDVPTNSDVALILKQYINCFEKLRVDNIVLDYVTWYWVIDGEQSDIETSGPRKLKEN